MTWMLNVYFNTTKTPKVRSYTVPRAGAWVNIEAPTTVELEYIAKKLKLDIDLLNDGIDPNESPRIERDVNSIYIYTRYCLPESEKQTTSPLLLILTPNNLVTIARRPYNDHKPIIKKAGSTQNQAQLALEILTQINNGYSKRINNVSKRIWQIRSQLDKSHIDNKDFISFIDLEEDLSDFLLALEPMNTSLNTLLSAKYFRAYEEDRDDFEDLELTTKELIGLANSRLKTIQNIREAYSTITANNLNKVFKLMTSITILMSIFTIITGVYSMNIALPLAHEGYVFWVLLGFSALIIGVLATIFRRKKWL